MAKRTTIAISSIDELENLVSSDTTFQVRVAKQGLCLITDFYFILWQGNEEELIDYLEENLFDIY